MLGCRGNAREEATFLEEPVTNFGMKRYRRLASQRDLPPSIRERIALRDRAGRRTRRHRLDLDGRAARHTAQRDRFRSGLLAADLTGSLYAVMREFDAGPYSADEDLEATQATDQQAEILGVNPGSPLLLITRTSFSEEGVAVEFSHDYHRSDRTRIRIKSRVESGSPARDASG